MLSVDKALHSPLLSPPTSPRMSTYATDSPGSNWQSRDTHGHDVTSYSSFASMGANRYSSSPSARPSLIRSAKSVPNFLEPSFPTPRSHSALGTGSDTSTAPDAKEKLVSLATLSEPPLSLETSGIEPPPAQQLTTPTSPTNNDSGLEDDTLMRDDDDDDIIDGDGDGKSGTLSRADKRKMKRFRCVSCLTWLNHASNKH